MIGELSDHARSNPDYDVRHLDAFASVGLGWGAVGYGSMKDLLPGEYTRLALELMHDIMLLQEAGDNTESERNAILGLWDSMLRDYLGDLPAVLNTMMTVDQCIFHQTDPLPPFVADCLAWNRVIVVLVEDGMGRTTCSGLGMRSRTTS